MSYLVYELQLYFFVFSAFEGFFLIQMKNDLINRILENALIPLRKNAWHILSISPT